MQWEENMKWFYISLVTAFLYALSNLLFMFICTIFDKPCSLPVTFSFKNSSSRAGNVTQGWPHAQDPGFDPQDQIN